MVVRCENHTNTHTHTHTHTQALCGQNGEFLR